MSDWQEITLGEISSIEIGGTPSRSEERYWWKSDNDGIRLPWVSISDMKGRVITDTKESITEIGALQSNCKHVSKGTLLMSFKLTIGRLAFAGRDLYTNEAISAIRPTKDVHPEFLYYGLQHWNLTGDSDQAVKGVTLNKQKLQEIPCLLPPLPEQKKIAEMLSGIDRLVEAKERRVKQRKLLLKSAFEDATKKSSSDNFVPLSNLGRWRGGGTPSKSIPEYWGGAIPWVSPKDMKGRKISCSQDAITQEAVENSTTSLIPKDSILFVVRSGVLRHTFPIALATREVAINQDLKALTVSDHCNANFLLHYLCCRSEEILASCMKSGTTVESIDTNSLQNYQVPAISIREQLRLSLFAESIATAIEVEQSQVESLKMLKSSLSSDLLSGRKRVSV